MSRPRTGIDRAKFTTIAVSPENMARIASLGKFGDSYNDIIERILEKAGIP